MKLENPKLMKYIVGQLQTFKGTDTRTRKESLKYAEKIATKIIIKVSSVIA